MYWNGLDYAFERELTQILDFNEILNRAEDTLAYQNLTRFSLRTKARGKVRHRTNSSVVEATLKANFADRRVALCDADAKSQIVAMLSPALREF